MKYQDYLKNYFSKAIVIKFWIVTVFLEEI